MSSFKGKKYIKGKLVAGIWIFNSIYKGWYFIKTKN